MTSVAQYLRAFSLLLTAPAIPPPEATEAEASAIPSTTIDLSTLRCTFTVKRGDYQTPNTCDVRVYNLSSQTAISLGSHGLTNYEFSQLKLSAGYPGNIGQIFSGTVKQVRSGRLNQTDSYVDITAADGDEAYNYSVVALSLAKGFNRPRDVIQAMIAGMANVVEGYVPELPTNGLTRGEVYYGQARDELSAAAKNVNSSWSIQDGQVNVIPLTSYIPSGNVPLISPQTGLIGLPEQTSNGIYMRVLLNPNIKIGQVVKLDSATINRYRYGLDIVSQQSNQLISLSNATNADGLYYVMVADHVGDTRGNEWYTDLTCLSVNAQIPQSLTTQAAIDPAAASIARFP